MPPKTEAQPAPEGMLGATNPERVKPSSINRAKFLTFFITTQTQMRPSRLRPKPLLSSFRCLPSVRKMI